MDVGRGLQFWSSQIIQEIKILAYAFAGIQIFKVKFWRSYAF